jgi:hypothetical protein
MTESYRNISIAASVMQQICTLLLAGLALALLGATIAAALGLLPWISLPVAFGDAPVTDAGIYAQVGLTVLLLLLLGFLPSNARVRRLEVTNRDFHINMQDVAEAYHHCHQADREGVFTLGREFDAMRERISWMRQHPDLMELEHDVLQLAAQMSVESRELAEIYSEEKVGRARTFLSQRQKEVEGYRDRISMAQATVQEMKRWMQTISTEEGLAEKQLERLQKDLAEITDAMRLTGHDKPENVVRMGRRDGTSDSAATPAE